MGDAGLNANPVAAAIAALVAAGYEQDGETRTEEVRMPTGQFSIVGHGKAGGKLTRLGGRLRYRRGDEFATVGTRTTCFYRLVRPAENRLSRLDVLAGRRASPKPHPDFFENIPTRDTGRIAERAAMPAKTDHTQLFKA